MNETKKLVVLLVLIATLVVIAVVVFLRPKRAGRVREQAEASAPAESAPAPLPSEEDLGKLTAWLITDESADLVAKCPDSGVFGLEATLAKNDASAATAFVPSSAPFVAPPRLDGVIWRSGEGSALFDGETYTKGARIHNTSYTVVDIARASVTLLSEGGRRLQLDLRN